MLKRPQYIALGVVVVLTVVLLKLPQRTASSFKLAIRGLFLPLFGLAGSADQLAEGAGNAVIPRAELIHQLEATQKQLQELRLRSAQSDAIAQENARFRQYFGWQRQAPWKMKLARVVARDPANWWRTFKIDLGARDGVQTNAPVLTVDGLVGRVSEVGLIQSQVVLVGNPDCRVAAVIEESREQGIIAPADANPMDTSLVDLGYLSRSSQPRAGQRVITSGIGGVFPRGIVIGQIVDSRKFELYTQARIKLEVRMNQIEEAWVLLP